MFKQYILGQYFWKYFIKHNGFLITKKKKSRTFK